jgi:hypothetical protein
MEQLERAYFFEDGYRKGIEFNSKIKLFAKIYDEEANWEINFICQDGSLEIKQLDQNFVHFKSYFAGELEVDMIINLRQVKDLKELKNELIEKSFLNSLISIENQGRSFAEMIVFAIQEYRKIFNDYNKNNAFLWEDTGFDCAYELYKFLKS